MGGEKAKYPPIFSLLSAVAVLGSRKIDLVAIAASDVEVEKGDEAADEAEEGKNQDDDVEITLTAGQLRQIARYIGYEESLERGNIEFMIFADGETRDVEGLVEVKQVLPTANMILTDPTKNNPL